LKIKKINNKKHEKPIFVYCLMEPINNEILVVGESGKNYASYQTTNLAFAFLQSPYSFQNTLGEKWTDEQIDAYIKNNKLKIIVDSKTGIPNKYLTVATGINEKFFKKFNKLPVYFDKMRGFAEKNGYVDCPIFPGLRRHLPDLLQRGSKLPKKKLSHYSNLDNITVNTGAQGGESVYVNKALVKIYDTIKEKNLKSRLIATVHDSIVLYVHKTEIKEMYYTLKNAMECFDYEIPILCEIEMGRIWGFGKEITEKNLDVFSEKAFRGSSFFNKELVNGIK